MVQVAEPLQISLIANVSRPRYCLGRNVGTENVLTVTKKLIVVAKGAPTGSQFQMRGAANTKGSAADC